MTGKSIEIIIPIRNMADQLHLCVSPPLLAQCSGVDVVTVVDDASTDRTAETARALGARVQSVKSSAGPPITLGNSPRERPRRTSCCLSTGDADHCRGLMDSHRAMHADEGIALSCTATRTRTGPTLAARVAGGAAAVQPGQLYRVRGRMDYYPTANLGINASVFREVGGFRAMRSGADADICWRIQESSLGGLAADQRVLMEWEPRSSLRDLAGQWYRYGESAAYLEWLYAAEESPILGKWDSLSGMLSERVKRMLRAHPRRTLPA